MRGALQPGPDPCSPADVHNMAKAHGQFSCHSNQTMGKQAIGHGRIEQRGDETAMKAVRIAFKTRRAIEDSFHLTLVIHLKLQYQAIAVLPATGKAMTKPGRAARIEIALHRFNRQRESIEFMHRYKQCKTHARTRLPSGRTVTPAARWICSPIFQKNSALVLARCKYMPQNKLA